MLAVLAASVLLLLVMFPAFANTKLHNHGAVCGNNLRQIGIAMLSYAADNNDQFHNINGSIPNYGQWTANPRDTNMLPANHSLAYWGVAYFPYAGRSRELFRCPSAQQVDQFREDGITYPAEFGLNSTYGVNQYVVNPYSPGSGTVRVSSIEFPDTMVLAQDAGEAKMEGTGDSIGLFPGMPKILTQWLDVLGPAYYGGYPFQWEWYRHDKRCNTLWVSGAVSKIPFNGLNVGIDYRYYTGEKPVLPLPGQ